MSHTHEEFRRRLETELAQVRETLQAMAIESRERLGIRVRRIEAALARVQAGAFGKCCQCGAEVEAERLQLDATTVFCADCQEEREAQRGADA